MRDHHNRKARVACFRLGDRQTQVVDQGGPSIGAEMAGFVVGGQRGAVASVIMPVHQVTCGRERVGDMVVPANVLTHAVEQHHDAGGRLPAVSVPAIGG
jgi:hypothetical protein